MEFKNPWKYLAEFNSDSTATLARQRGNWEETNWRREGYLNPFCHLVIRAIRWDSCPPFHSSSEAIASALLGARSRLGLTRRQLAAKLGITLATVANWECGRTKPTRRLWKAVSRLIRPAACAALPLPHCSAVHQIEAGFFNGHTSQVRRKPAVEN